MITHFQSRHFDPSKPFDVIFKRGHTLRSEFGKELKLGIATATLKQTSRVRSIDWLRGVAVICMIECHALHLLDPIHDHDWLRNQLNYFNGLPAPTFILCAGLSIGLVSSRIDSSFDARLKRYLKTLYRIGVVLLSSMFLKQLHWNFFKYPERFFWPNVLDCIALSLVLISTIVLFFPYRRVALALLCGSLFAIAPLVQKPHTFGFFTPLINNSVYSDTWPLVPWAGYACIGAIIGLSMNQNRDPNRLTKLFLGLSLLGWMIAICWPFFDLMYLPKHTGFYIINGGERVAYIGLIGLALCLIERSSRSRPIIINNPFTRLVELYSRQSLVAYIGHLLIFYGLGFIRPYNAFHQQCDWLVYSLLAISLMTLTAILCYLFDLIPHLLQKISIQRDVSSPNPAIIQNHE